MTESFLSKYLNPDIVSVVERCMVFTPETTNELREAVREWDEDRISAVSKYGHISNWDVSGITDMYSLFENMQIGRASCRERVSVFV